LDPQEFHLEEYNALRGEIIHHAEVNASIEREAVIGNVAVYAWGLTQSHSISAQTGHLSLIFMSLVFVLPCVLTFVSWIRARKHGDRINMLGKYISNLEEAFDERVRVTIQRPHSEPQYETVFGWEHFLAKSRPNAYDRARSDPLGKSTDERWQLYFYLTVGCSALLAFLKLGQSIHIDGMPF
jgi:hypothetical protein